MRYARSPHFVTRRIDEETVLVPFGEAARRLRAIYMLDAVGAFIWERLAEPADAGRIADLVAGEFEASRDVALHDAEEFLAELVAAGCAEEVGDAP